VPVEFGEEIRRRRTAKPLRVGVRVRKIEEDDPVSATTVALVSFRVKRIDPLAPFGSLAV